MDFSVGQTIRDYFTIQDSSGVNLTGVTWNVGSTEDPNGDPFTATVTEIGDGVYYVTLFPDTEGIWYYRIDSTNITPAQSFEESFIVEAAAPTANLTIGAAADGPTLNDLIMATAVRNSDFLEVEATQPGSIDGTSFQDELRLAAIPSQSLKGASITIISPDTSDNYLIERRVSDSSEDTQVLTITPAFPAQVQAGEVAWITNLLSQGSWRSQYKNAINEAIASAYPSNLVRVEYTHPDPWDQDNPYITLDASITHIYGVRVDDGTTDPTLIPQSAQNISVYPGWFYDFGLGQLGLSGDFRYAANGATVSVLGYGRSPVLVDATDRTSVDREWIVFYAAEIVKGGKGDQKLMAQASRMENRADIVRPKIITGLEPNVLQIRG